MAHIKRMVMHGFKSFIRKTDLPFTQGINVILGPNGSGKSNVSDALCFVLGRLSIKSMRAAKAKNLIFLGTKAAPPAREAAVEVVFDNSDNTFTLDSTEVSIKRTVRKTGQSIYKINDHIKTRQEVLALLAQAGIDPNGFNIILQGEIQNFVRMRPEDRRKIIEEVSGISVYELRKQKSLRELEKTEDKLKEVHSILRERTAYLNNLEKERQQALRFKKLEKNTKSYKASIINHDLMKGRKESLGIDKDIEGKNKDIEKVKKTIITMQAEISNLESKATSINQTIQSKTGLEQEKLNSEIADLRAELAGLNVKNENYDAKLSEIQRKKHDFKNIVEETEAGLKDLQKESPSLSKKKQDLDSKKHELDILEEKRKRFYMIKSELRSIKERFEDKRNLLRNYENESEFLAKQIATMSNELFDKRTTPQIVDMLRVQLAEKQNMLKNLDNREADLTKVAYTNEYEINKQEKLKEKISKMDVCPVCKNKITHDHVNHIKEEITPQIEQLKKEIESSDKEVTDIHKRKDILKQDIDGINTELSNRAIDLLKLSSIRDKKSQIQTKEEKIRETNEELLQIEKVKKRLERDYQDDETVEQKYETARVEVQEISIRSKETVDSEISFKQREVERSQIALKQLKREEQDINEELEDIGNSIDEKENLLEKKNKQEQELTKKFHKLIEERESYQKKARQDEIQVSEKKNHTHNIEQDINNFKIDKARIDATVEALETEMLEFPNIELAKGSKEVLIQKLEKTQETLTRIGSVNLRSLEVYDSIKKEYDIIKEKAEIIDKEKEGILKIIHTIDVKKKKVFLLTFKQLNDIFGRNFSQLSTKGQVYLDLEDKKDPFAAGVNIIVKTGHGKYFDVTSLSGGEQTLVALALIFAIQELNPYCFYILDEIDAALDKRNSERLAGLLLKYMEKGQYIVVTHNDEVISRATNLYGVSMHDGVSKIISLKV
ncbi:chromosome segregation SMC family protein [Nanoarchaeota archaeon]